MSSVKWRPFCLGLNDLIWLSGTNSESKHKHYHSFEDMVCKTSAFYSSPHCINTVMRSPEYSKQIGHRQNDMKPTFVVMLFLLDHDFHVWSTGKQEGNSVSFPTHTVSSEYLIVPMNNPSSSGSSRHLPAVRAVHGDYQWTRENSGNSHWSHEPRMHCNWDIPLPIFRLANHKKVPANWRSCPIAHWQSHTRLELYSRLFIAAGW